MMGQKTAKKLADWFCHGALPLFHHMGAVFPQGSDCRAPLHRLVSFQFWEIKMSSSRRQSGKPANEKENLV